MTVRWGFLGAGFVASRGVAPVVHGSASAVLQCVAARDLARAEALDPVRAVTSYDELCDADDVDVVYISLPNDAHLVWVDRALAAGKHVLCEKPLALDADQVRRMQAAAQASGTLLVEAAWNRWHPRTRRIEQLMAAVDPPVEATAWFTFPGVPDDNYRLDPTRGGGALLDVGCYALGAALLALGDDAAVETAEAHVGPTGVDLTTSAALRSARGTASVRGSFEQPESQGWTVTAPGFSLDVPHPAFTSWREPAALRVTVDGAERVEEFDACDAYALMVDAVSERAAGGDAWVLPLTTSLAVATVVDRVREASAR
jgi:D-xylose 1-dehydrogenase (NADP+, D-xylono-1,5-lactone-forming)